MRNSHASMAQFNPLIFSLAVEPTVKKGVFIFPNGDKYGMHDEL